MRTMRNSRMMRRPGGGGYGKTTWRIVMSSYGATVRIWRMEFRSTPSGPAITSGVSSEGMQRACGSSRKSTTNHGADWAFQTSYFWESETNTDEWISWRFDEAVEVNEVKWVTQSSGSYSPYDVTVQSSSDGGVTWDDEWTDTVATTASTTITTTRP